MPQPQLNDTTLVNRPEEANGVIMLSGLLGLPDHRLCITVMVTVRAHPTLRSPSLLDCLVHIVSQVIQGMSAYDIVFHNPLPALHSTACPAMTSPDAPGLILMAGAYHPPLPLCPG